MGIPRLFVYEHNVFRLIQPCNYLALFQSFGSRIYLLLEPTHTSRTGKFRMNIERQDHAYALIFQSMNDSVI